MYISRVNISLILGVVICGYIYIYIYIYRTVGFRNECLEMVSISTILFGEGQISQWFVDIRYIAVMLGDACDRNVENLYVPLIWGYGSYWKKNDNK